MANENFPSPAELEQSLQRVASLRQALVQASEPLRALSAQQQQTFQNISTGLQGVLGSHREVVQESASLWKIGLFVLLEGRLRSFEDLSRQVLRSFANEAVSALAGLALKKGGDAGGVLSDLLTDGGDGGSEAGLLSALVGKRQSSRSTGDTPTRQRIEVGGHITVSSPDGTVQQMPPELVQAIAARAAQGEIENQVSSGRGPLGAQLAEFKRAARH